MSARPGVEILALWEDRSVPHPTATARKPRDHAETSERVRRSGANDPPRAPFSAPRPPRTSRGLPDRSFRRCSGVPRRSANRVTEREARGNYHHAKGLDAKGRTRPPPQSRKKRIGRWMLRCSVLQVSSTRQLSIWISADRKCLHTLRSKRRVGKPSSAGLLTIQRRRKKSMKKVVFDKACMCLEKI